MVSLRSCMASWQSMHHRYPLSYRFWRMDGCLSIPEDNLNHWDARDVALRYKPLVGVIVAEYVIGQRGLGNLLFRTIPAGLAERWIYALGCVTTACMLLLVVSAIALRILPSDIRLE